jgi:hypothetical protein
MVRVDLENKFDKLGEVTDGLLESEVGVDAGNLPSINFPVEVLSESKDVQGDAATRSTGDVAISANDGSAASKVTDFSSLNPPVKQMKAEIEAELSSELRTLNKKKRQYSRNVKKNAMLFNDVIKEIRKIVRILESLAVISYEELKKLWLRLIHKVV